MGKLYRTAILFAALLLVSQMVLADIIQSILSEGSEREMFVDGGQGQAIINRSSATRDPRNGNITLKANPKGQGIYSRDDRRGRLGIRATHRFDFDPDSGWYDLESKWSVSDYTTKVAAGRTRTNVNDKLAYGAWYAKLMKAGQTRTANAEGDFTDWGCTLTGENSDDLANVHGVWIKTAVSNAKAAVLRSDGKFITRVMAGAVSVVV